MYVAVARRIFASGLHEGKSALLRALSYYCGENNPTATMDGIDPLSLVIDIEIKRMRKDPSDLIEMRDSPNLLLFFPRPR